MDRIIEITRKFKLVLICFRHGINPFATLEEGVEKMRDRFSEKEKRWLVGITNKYLKEYLQKNLTERY